MSTFFDVAKFFHKIVVQFSTGYHSADILCTCTMFSLMHIDAIYNMQYNIQYMPYIFVMGTTYTEPYQRPQKG